MLERLGGEVGSEGRRGGEEMLEEGFEGVVRGRGGGGHGERGRKEVGQMTRIEVEGGASSG